VDRVMSVYTTGLPNSRVMSTYQADQADLPDNQ